MAQQIILTHKLAAAALSLKEPTQIGNTKNPFAMNILKTAFAFFFALCFMMGANSYAQTTVRINAEASKRELKKMQSTYHQLWKSMPTRFSSIRDLS